MARIVTFSFKDNVAAEAVIEAVDILQDTGHPMTIQEFAQVAERLGSIMGASATPQVLMARPTAWCTCKYKVTRATGKVTPRFGWLVCKTCNKPAEVVVRNWMGNLVNSVMGNNLLQALRDKLAADRATEDDEDPQEILDKFDQGADGVTTKPAGEG